MGGGKDKEKEKERKKIRGSNASEGCIWVLDLSREREKEKEKQRELLTLLSMCSIGEKKLLTQTCKSSSVPTKKEKNLAPTSFSFPSLFISFYFPSINT